jgi:hypothetical protein
MEGMCKSWELGSENSEDLGTKGNSVVSAYTRTQGQVYSQIESSDNTAPKPFLSPL